MDRQTPEQEPLNYVDFVMKMSENWHDLNALMQTARFVRERLDQIDENPGEDMRANLARECAASVRSMEQDTHDLCTAYQTLRFSILEYQKKTWAKKDPSEH